LVLRFYQTIFEEIFNSPNKKHMANIVALKQMMESSAVKEKLSSLLNRRPDAFISSALQAVSGNSYLEKADPRTVLNACATAAALDLPINKNLGFAWIVPYKGNAQFQMGWRGYVQLALRTGQYLRINVTPVYKNQAPIYNSLTEEFNADFSVDGEGEAVGFVAYFKLINGFEKTVYWTKEKVHQHANKYSKTYSGKNSVWKTDFEAMACKTVLKNTISKWGIMSIELQKAVLADQAVVLDDDTYQYPDNEEDKDTRTPMEIRLEELMTADINDGMDLIDFEEKYKEKVAEQESEYLTNVYKRLLLPEAETE
jgi:recombination protein RecT